MSQYKNRTVMAVALVAVLVAGIAVGVSWSRWRSPQGAAAVASSAASQPAAADGAKRRVLYWHDPMKPDVRFDKPGKSPFMDMELQPVYADDDAGGEAPAVRVSAGASQALGIRVGTVERAALAPAIHAVGTVAYDETAQAVVQPRADGFVTRLRVRAPLVQVQKGEVLADVDIPAWREALAEYLALPLESGPGGAGQALPLLPHSPELRMALRQRLSVLGVPGASLQHAEQTGTVPDHFELTAPVTGVVTELGLREGAAFMNGTVVARINRTNTVWVDAQVLETQARAVTPGAPVRIQAHAHLGRVFTGQVLRVLPQVDSVTRTVGVRVAVLNGPGLLSPGMYVDADFPAVKATEQLWVPSEAVIATGERSVVIVARPGGGFDVATVTTGIEVGGKTAILSGLTAGQSVVLSGQFLIDSEANLKSAINRLSAGGASP